jgi:hypothetical protein
MSKEVNLGVLAKFAEAVNTGKFDLFKEAVAIENIDHGPARGQVPGARARRLSCVFRGITGRIPRFECGVGNLDCR